MKYVITCILAACSVMLCPAHNSYGIPAVPRWHILEQADGTVFRARLWGDEWRHVWRHESGHPIIFEKSTKNWHVATRDPQGRLVPSRHPVGPGPPDLKSIPPFRWEDAPMDRPARRQSHAETLPDGAPTMAQAGTAMIPVVLIAFPDKSHTVDPREFEALLFGSDSGSMRAYYEAVSYGSFTVATGPAGVVGWYQSIREHDYYGANHPFWGFDRRPAELVTEAVRAADADVDFSDYDLDGDCYCDVVAVIHQGSGEEDGSEPENIWSHQWDLNSARLFDDGDGEYTTNDTAPCGSIKINKYIIQPETFAGEMQTVGVFAHEYGHVLGLPDLYDADGSSEGIGNWGLMGHGGWTGVDRPGDTPAHMSAWSKYFLGWVTPIKVTDQIHQVTLAPVATAPDIYQFLPGNPARGGEYFLVENRQRIGFDAALPGSGLAIWHIDEKKSDNTEACAPPDNCSTAHYKVALVQADNDWGLERGTSDGDRGDLFPGRSNNRVFSNRSLPGSALYGGAPSGVHISDIASNGDSITATFTGNIQLYAEETGIFRNGIFQVDANGNRASDSEDLRYYFGMTGDLPVTGDWAGDGLTNIGIFHEGVFSLDVNGNYVPDTSDARFSFGQAGDTPVTGDWNGDGITDIGIFRDGLFLLDINDNFAVDAGDAWFIYGRAGDVPLAGRWE